MKTKELPEIKRAYYRLLNIVFEKNSAIQYDKDMEEEGLCYFDRLDMVSVYPEAAIFVGRKKGTWG